MSPHKPRLRPWAMRLHRWMALALGAWFALVGLSGSVLVWHGDLDRALNPQWFAPRHGCGVDASAPEVRANAKAAAPSAAPATTPIATALAIFARTTPGAIPTQVMRPAEPGAAYTVWQQPGADGHRIQHFIDPDCGQHLGTRQWGAVDFDRAHFVPALYELHRSLLSGDAGHVVVGFAGLFLLAVAITGLLTAWPRHFSRADWKRVLTLKPGAATHRRYYDLHRATGMWLFVFIALMSITGAYLCFPRQGRALVAGVLPTSPASLRTEALEPATAGKVQVRAGSGADLDALVRRAEGLWTDAAWSRIQIPADDSQLYDIRLLQRAELRMDTGDTRARLGAAGDIVDTRDPLRAPVGDTLISWLFPLHSGEALGLAGRLAWTLFGVAPPLLFATGVWLWVKRRRARYHRGAHPAAASR